MRIILDDFTITILKKWREVQIKNDDKDYVISRFGEPLCKSTISRIIKRHAMFDISRRKNTRTNLFIHNDRVIIIVVLQTARIAFYFSKNRKLYFMCIQLHKSYSQHY